MTDGDAATTSAPVTAPVDPPLPEVKTDKVEAPTSSPTYNVETMDMRTYFKHISMWVDPYLSAKVLAVVSIIFYYTGSNGYALPCFIALLLLERTVIVFGFNYAGNFLKSKEASIAKRAGEGLIKTGAFVKSYTELPNQKRVSFWTEGIGTYLEMRLSDAFSAMKKAETDPRMLKVVLGHLVVFFLAFYLFSVRTLVFGALFFALTVPAVYSKQKERIDPLLEKGQEKLKPHLDKMTEKGKELAEKAQTKLNENLEKVKAKVAELRKPKTAEGDEAKKEN